MVSAAKAALEKHNELVANNNKAINSTTVAAPVTAASPAPRPRGRPPLRPVSVSITAAAPVTAEKEPSNSQMSAVVTPDENDR